MHLCLLSKAITLTHTLSNVYDKPIFLPWLYVCVTLEILFVGNCRNKWEEHVPWENEMKNHFHPVCVYVWYVLVYNIHMPIWHKLKVFFLHRTHAILCIDVCCYKWLVVALRWNEASPLYKHTQDYIQIYEKKI